MRETLDRLQNWFEVHRPEYARCLQPGLSDVEIAEKLAEIPAFHLCDEFYELYRWHNGNRLHEEYPNSWSLNDFIPNNRFLPLEEAVKICQDMMIGAVESGGEMMMEPIVSGHCDWSHYYLPILEEERIDLVIVVGIDNGNLLNPVVHRYGEDANITLLHRSLSNFMNFILECYETGVYQFEMDLEGSFRWVRIDKVRTQLIHHKYDPDVEYSYYL